MRGLRSNISDEARGVFLVVCTLIITATYQTALQPCECGFRGDATDFSTRRISSDTSDEARGVFLIICTLLITATYQTALPPPGGVNQSDGHAVMKHTFFIVPWFLTL
ncbi:unnamed protein product [Arabidopsis lyrata]|nr:unnamed protein product [Arabidopsis lyrata]